MKWLKRLFCEHIWKAEHSESLGMFTRLIVGVPIENYEKFAVHECCVKCGKKRIIQAKGEGTYTGEWKWREHGKKQKR